MNTLEPADDTEIELTIEAALDHGLHLSRDEAAVAFMRGLKASFERPYAYPPEPPPSGTEIVL